MRYIPFSARIRLSRLPYYVSSISLLIRNINKDCRLRFFKDILLPTNTRTIYLKNGLVFRTKTLLDLLTLKEVIFDREYENHGIKVSPKDRLVVDVGAGYGDFSILIAKKFPHINIYAFEPDAVYFSLFQENLKLNRIKNVYAYNETIDTLAHIFRATNDRVDFLKMDCEGAEFPIIKKGGKSYFSKIGKISMEYHESDRDKVNILTSILTKSGFKVHVDPHTKVSNIGHLSASAISS